MTLRSAKGLRFWERQDHYPFHDARDMGRKEGRAWALTTGKAWAEQRFGVTEWKRNRMGDYVDARVFKRFPLRKEAKP